MTLDIDKRTKRGRELAQRLNQQTILDNMPKLYYVEDPHNGGYRVGRTDWPGDVFNIVSKAEFDCVLKVLNGLNYPVLDKTYED